MNDELPLYEPDVNATYRLEIVARMTGISEQTILYYQEQGLIQPTGDEGDFDEEALLTLRRIEQLRSAYGADFPGLKLILGLLDQVEWLQSELRARR